MKNISFIIAFVSVLFVGCTDDFGETNTNTNAPENVGPEFLLTNAINTQIFENTYNQGLRLNGYLVQYVASIEFERIDRYELGSNSGYWNLLYNALQDLESMKEQAGYNEAYDGVAMILRSYYFSQLTDLWCDVPYREALGAKTKNFTPAYDAQEDIYMDPETGILAQLEKAATQLQNTQESIRGDVLFNNDLNKWVRLANSLRVRYYLRISKRVTDFSKLQQLADSGMLMQGNADNAVLPYLGAAPNQFPLFNAPVGIYRELTMTKQVEAVLKSWDDPRIRTFYAFTGESTKPGNTPAYKGLLSGQDKSTISDKEINLNDISLLSPLFRESPDAVDAQLMQYAELQFCLAEAAARGYITGSAQSYYQNAINATFAYYETTVPDDYFTRPAIALSASQTDNLTKILTQKWFSLFNVGHEAWFNIRRTGIPALTPGPDNFNDGKYPSRYLYPESEQATNSANYKTAVDRIGGDDINTKCWWEK